MQFFDILRIKIMKILRIWRKIFCESHHRFKCSIRCLISCVATSVLRKRLLHVVVFSTKLRWLAQTKVITLKMQLHTVNARWKRLSQLSLKLRCNERFTHAVSTLWKRLSQRSFKSNETTEGLIKRRLLDFLFLSVSHSSINSVRISD